MRISRLPAAFPRTLSPAWGQALAAWLCGRVVLTGWGMALASSKLVPLSLPLWRYEGVEPVNTGLAGSILGVWQRWDTLHYQRISLYGYAGSPEASAFFPLFPLLGRWASGLTGLDSLAGLLLVSNIAFYLLLVVFFRLAEQDDGPETARRAVFSAALFPTSFFFYAGYPLSLALLFTVLSYALARNQRWLPAATAGILAGLAHSTVLPLAAMLLYEAAMQVRQARPLKITGMLAACAAPLLGVALFLAWRAGQGYPSLPDMMAGGWGRVVQSPLRTLADIPAAFASGEVHGAMYLDLLMLALLLAAAGLGWKRLRGPEWLYNAALLVYMLTTAVKGEPLTSYCRYGLMSFPLFVLAGQLTGRKWARTAGFAIGLSLELFASGVFFLWGWVG